MLSTIAGQHRRSAEEPHRLQPEPALRRIRCGLGEVADHAGVDQPADHDEQAGEERQGRPLDIAMASVGVTSVMIEQQSGAEQGDDRGLVVQHRVQHEPGQHEEQDQHGLDEQAACP